MDVVRLRRAGGDGRQEPSLLADGCLLITGEVDPTTEFERGMAAAHQWTGSAWQHDPLIVDDQGVVVHVRGRDLVVLIGCGHAGGCWQPASACHVHHVRHKARGGKTSVKDCVLLCAFHHLIVIHHWGWTLAMNGDGSTTAWNKNRTKVLHSHGPPARAG